MYEKSKTNLDNVLQKIKSNNLPFILLLIILIIIMMVTIITDYFSFSKSKSKFEGFQGFDIPNNNRIPRNIDLSQQQEQGDITESGSDDQIPVGDEELLNDYRRSNPDDYDNYKRQYDQYKKESDKYKNESDKINKISNDLKDYNKDKINNYFDNYGTNIKNELLSAVNNESTNAKNKIPNFNISIPTIKDPKISNSIIVVSFILIALILCFVFIPSFSNFKSLLNQISSVTYVILYTIFLILFLRLLPINIMNSNAYYIVPITIIIAVFLFILGFRSNYASEFNVNYERIKMIILYFCFITICTTYYVVNPGDYITKNLNMSSLFAVLIGVFGFIYLIVLLTLPENYNIFSNSGSSGSSNSSTSSNSAKNITNALANMSSFSKYGGIGFILFLAIMTTVIATYPGGFFKNTKTSIIIMVLLLVISIIWSILLVVNMFTGFNSNNPSGFMDSNLTYVKKTILALLGFTLSGIIIGYIVYSVQNLSGRSGIASFILSIFLILCVFILIYKTIFVKLPSNNANKAKNGFFNLIINLIFYIPCLFSGVFDGIMKTLVSGYNSTTTGNVLILIVTMCLLILYIYLPKIQHNVNLQGGKQLVENPVNTNTMHSLANYIELNGSEHFDYHYSISFWLFIDSNAPNTNPSYNQYTSLLNYGGKPNILYKAKTNTLIITMDQKDLAKESKNKLLDFDDNGNRIIYTNKNILLQKWNNIIVQFNGGTLDVFLNGDLVKSSIEVIPYMKLDMLTIGSDGGVNGGICNVVYHKTPLTITNIYYIYKNVKDKNPPVIQKSNNTIIPMTK